MKKLKVTKGEAQVLGMMVATATEPMKSGMHATQRQFASVSRKINELNSLDQSKVKKVKPLTKKAVRDILKQVLPTNQTSREGFLSTLQQNINSKFN